MIYLDNAATSYPKPRAVIEETARCMREYGGNPGRGSHPLALRAAEKIYECREEIAHLFASPFPENVSFAMNATMALNTVIKGVLKRGDHVLISDMEHNAVLRPIYRLAREKRIRYTVFPTFARFPERTDEDILNAIRERIRPSTRLLVASHASNICSATLPIEKIGALCREHGIFFCVDAAQSAGHLPIDVVRMQIDALCFPSHKGLLGPQGAGGIVWGDGVISQALIEGGSGYDSFNPEMPNDPPERYEAGTLPTPIIAGLCEGIRTLQTQGIARMHEHVCSLNKRLSAHLCALPFVTVHAKHHVGEVLLFSATGVPSDTIGQKLSSLGFCVRTGYHCAPLAHTSLGTPEGGAVRVSPSFCTEEEEIDEFANALEDALEKLKK
ncbi:MAG: aminotransferase class V-fold PLP-dependent enzyme [Ruminococcaceae bacterium]|nr:aminotransferase class V-fold PLP-dependent enzyme [Oscillospiraceae bacterium]